MCVESASHHHFPAVFYFLGVWPEMYRCARRGHNVRSQWPGDICPPPSESWDYSQRKRGEIIEARKPCNEIDNSRGAELSLTD